MLFISKSLNNLTPSGFNTWFGSRQGNVIRSSYKINRYGKYSIMAIAPESWSKIRKQLKNTLLKDLSPTNIKTVISNFYLKSY